MESPARFHVGQRVHHSADPRRCGTVKYAGSVEGYPGMWIGVDWDGGQGKHDGSLNGVTYFRARSDQSGSFVRAPSLSPGISFLDALRVRYRDKATKEEEDGMYVLSASNKRVSVELVGKDKIQDKLGRFDELTSVSLSYLGISGPGSPNDISSAVPNLKELDLTGNLLSKWKDVGAICEQLPALQALNLSSNLMDHEISGLAQLSSIRILVLNNTGITWTQVELLKDLLPAIEELHLIGNDICKIEPKSSATTVQGFESLRLLNLDDNCIEDWNEIVKLAFLGRLEQLHLNKNNLKHIIYPNADVVHELLGTGASGEESCVPFQNLSCLLLGSNDIGDMASVDSLNSFPKLVDIRLSENPISDPAKGGFPRYVLIARLPKIEVLNGSEVGARERKDSEIRYVRLVMSTCHESGDKIKELHPRFTELKHFHGIEDQRSSVGVSGPRKMSSGLISITLKCVGPTIAEKQPITKKLPASTSVGKLKILCESFFRLHSVKLKLFLQETGSPMPMLLDDEMATLLDAGVGDVSTILVDEES